MNIITENTIRDFKAHLIEDEKSAATAEKYLHIANHFKAFAGEQPVSKELTVLYKQKLTKEFSARTVNVYIAGLNRLLRFIGLEDCTVKSLKIQRQVYLAEEKELTKSEYMRLLGSASPKLRLIMETICGTGIRVSELQYFTKESVEAGTIHIRLKGKCRDIIVNQKLRKKLLDYCRQNKIESGVIFLCKNGSPMNRSMIWAQMKKLCKAAGVLASKVFPHNLRKLFARCFYAIERDIAKLSDILGHSSIETTRIYIMTTAAAHRKQMDRLGLIS